MTSDPCTISNKALVVLSSAWSDSTLRVYNDGIAAFSRWCNRSGIPIKDRLPTHEALLCNFIADHAGLISGSTLRNYLSGLKALHIFHNLSFNYSERVRYMLKAASNLTPASSIRARRGPVTLVHLQLLWDSLSPISYLECAVLAAATTAFWCQARLGKLLPSSTSSTALDLTPKRLHLGAPTTKRGSRQLHLPWTKTTHTSGDTIIICILDECNPIRAMDIHLTVNDPPLDSHLFAFREKDGYRFLTKRLFLYTCNKIWRTIDITHSGHAFRIGGTTELLMRGTAPQVVQVLGRWSSDAFLRYWRNIDMLAEVHLEGLASSHRRQPAVCPPSVGVCPSPGLTSAPSGSHSGGLPRSVHPAVGQDGSPGDCRAPQADCRAVRVQDPDSPKVGERWFI
jgi:hypothetical protein